MPKYELNGYVSYTSYAKLTVQEEKGIANSQKPLPRWIVLPDGKRLDWQEELKCAEKKTRGGYAVLPSGIQLKYTSKASPDYHKPNGHGSCTMKLVIRSEQPLNFE